MKRQNNTVMGWVMRGAVAGLASLLMTTVVWAGEPRYEKPVLSDSKGGAAKNKFSKDTPQLFLESGVVDVPNGAKLGSAWIAEKPQVAPPNYRIDSKEMKKGPMENRVWFSLSRPNKGWPVGDYRVDLFINDKAAGSVKFSVVN